ncbi:MAG TPA: hypothetical protein PLC05_03505 [bacterium]|nr:hypothetical protein [bacterium]
MLCSFTKDNGETCGANAMSGSKFCYFHNPDITEDEKKRAQTKGGQNRALTISTPLATMPLANPNDAILLIADTINRVRTGELDIKTANCLGFLSDKFLRALEVAKLNDKVEFIERVVLEKRQNY